MTSKWLSRMRRLQKSTTLFDTPKIFNLDVDEGAIVKLLEVVPEELMRSVGTGTRMLKKKQEEKEITRE